MQQQIIPVTNIKKELSDFLQNADYDNLFILTDEHTEKLCLPKINEIPEIRTALKMVVPSGENHKNIRETEKIWEYLSNNHASRKSLMIILGGGLLTDMGGFAASTFKRGMDFVNIPTTLLGAVDAAVGGKTGINFAGLKNEIGVFSPAKAVLIDSRFFETLTHSELLSGYAEMLKHALLSSEADLNLILSFDLEKIDYALLNDLLFKSIKVKERIVKEDPHEKGIRKALNLGHTIGHAFESFSHETNRPIPHGYAVAWGILCELYLSIIKFDFDKNIFQEVARFVKEQYGKPDFDCSQYDHLIELMKHDKKNDSGEINFTLLKSVGNIAINQTASRQEIEETLDFIRDY